MKRGVAAASRAEDKQTSMTIDLYNLFKVCTLSKASLKSINNVNNVEPLLNMFVQCTLTIQHTLILALIGDNSFHVKAYYKK